MLPRGADAELLRLEDLRAYRVLDTQPDPEFEALTEFGARLCAAPAAFLSLLEESAITLFAAHGWHGPLEIPRGDNLCDLFLAGHTEVVYPDMSGQDYYGIRAYAGVPLVSPRGFVIGSFTAVAFEPRPFDPSHIDLLHLLSRQAVMILEGRKQARDLRDALEARSRFLATVSHEIRTPLNGIVGAGMLLSRTQLDLEQQELVQAVCNSGGLLLQLVNHILDLTKLEAHRVELASEPFQLGEIIDSVRANFAPLGRAKEVQLYFDPRALGDSLVHGDRLRLVQVLNNIVGNAVKFTPRGGEIHLAARRLPGPGAWEISVRDNGIGIAPGKLELIFGAFEQGAGDTSSNYGGTGLGLAISRELIRAMGGEITVESELGRGSTFTCRLAFSPPREIAPGLEVLLVEDNPINQFVARAMLRQLGCEVETAANGLLALAALHRQSFDLVLMDCQMPELDGFATTQAIRAAAPLPWSQIPIVALTAQTNSDDWQKCLDCGMNGFVPKPIEIETLKREILRNSPAHLPGDDHAARRGS